MAHSWDEDSSSDRIFPSLTTPGPAYPVPAANSYVESAPILVEEISCPICRQVNPLANQFCGFCGIKLQMSPAQVYQSHALAEDPLPKAVDELEFLRYRALSENEGAEEGGHRAWTFLVAGLAIVLGGFLAFQHYYNPSAQTSPAATTLAPPSEPAAQPEPAPPAAATNTPAHEAPALKPAEPETKAETTPAPTPAPALPATLKVEAAKVEVQKPPVPVETPATVVPASTKAPVHFVAPEGGAQELAYAEGLLAGNTGRRDSTAAAQWLWKSVSKQNTRAVLLLSDLYLAGDGVPKSCEQARLLLGIAAKKGNAPAAQKLRGISTQSCK